MQPNEKSLREQHPDVEWDYGDDIRDYENKERREWNNELQNNPMYRTYIERKIPEW